MTQDGLTAAILERGLLVGIVVGESSGDQLGAGLMQSLTRATHGNIRFVGVGGPLMQQQGLKSLFPMSDIAVNGLLPVIARLPLLLRRIKQTAEYLSTSNLDAVIHIDAQDFNQRVARKLKARSPDLPLIGYVSPTVWAWRPGRAKKIKRLFKRLLAVLPFEPDVHRRLGGPETIYVGHPLMGRQQDWIASAPDVSERARQPYQLLVLPGSRHSEINRLLPLFEDIITALARRVSNVEIVIPAVEHLVPSIEAATSNWAIRPRIIRGEAQKWQAFRTARAALAASGTVTLELALADVPTIVAYRVSYLEELLGRLLITTQFAALPNVILGRELMPEHIKRPQNIEDLVQGLFEIVVDSTKRTVQLSGFEEIRSIMAVEGASPSEKAAEAVLMTLSLAKSHDAAPPDA